MNKTIKESEETKETKKTVTESYGGYDTVGGLKEALEDYDDNLPLRLALQPSYPMTGSIENICIERDEEGNDVTLWIAASDHEDYGASKKMWRDGEISADDIDESKEEVTEASDTFDWADEEHGKNGEQYTWRVLQKLFPHLQFTKVSNAGPGGGWPEIKVSGKDRDVKRFMNWYMNEAPADKEEKFWKKINNMLDKVYGKSVTEASHKDDPRLEFDKEKKQYKATNTDNPEVDFTKDDYLELGAALSKYTRGKRHELFKELGLSKGEIIFCKMACGEELSIPEIAMVMGTSVGSVHLADHNAMEKMKKQAKRS